MCEDFSKELPVGVLVMRLNEQISVSFEYQNIGLSESVRAVRINLDHTFSLQIKNFPFR